ncbi:MAG: hypothetical protein LBL83_10210 [Clostridiales bacterium]|jgi:hypothetical protein|nr:hypothetical protein [Clostridiales bacterium]
MKMKKLAVFTLSALGVFLAAFLAGVVFGGFDHARYRVWVGAAWRSVALLSASALCVGLCASVYRAAGAIGKRIIRAMGAVALLASLVFHRVVFASAVLTLGFVFLPSRGEEIIVAGGRQIVKDYGGWFASSGEADYYEYNGWFLKGRHISASEIENAEDAEGTND